jgi:hypothetical protein
VHTTRQDILRFTDPIFSDLTKDWAGEYRQSHFARQTELIVYECQSQQKPDGIVLETNFATFGVQIANCFKRDMTIGSRDLTLYYMQCVMRDAACRCSS